MSDQVNLHERSLRALREMLRDDRAAMLRDIGGVIGKVSSGGLGSVEATKRFATLLGETTEELEAFIKTMTSPRNRANLTALDRSLLAMAQARKHHLDTLKQSAESQSENTEAVEENTNSVSSNTKEVNKARETVYKLGRGLKDFIIGLAYGYVQIKAFNTAVGEARESFRTGQPWDLFGDSLEAALRGMDPSSMMAFQAEFRRVSNTLTGGVKEFNDQIFANELELIRYTGSVKDGAIAMARMANTSHNLGLDLAGAQDTSNKLFKEFKKLRDNVSMTAEEFTTMVGTMAEDQTVKERLLSLQGKQRQAYMLGLVQQYHSLRLSGMQSEAAKRLISTLNEMSNQKQVDKIVGSAKEGVYLRQLGIDPKQILEYMTLRRDPNATPDGNARIAEILEEASRRRTNILTSGSREDREMKALMWQATEANLGVEELLKPLQDKVLQTSAKANDETIIAHNEKLQEEANHYLLRMKDDIIQIHDILAAWSQTTIGQLTGLAVATILGHIAVRSLFKGITDAVIRGRGDGVEAPDGSGQDGDKGKRKRPKGRGRLPSLGNSARVLGAGGLLGLGGMAVDYSMGSDMSTEDGPRLIKEAVAQGLSGAGIASLAAPLAGPFAPLVIAAGGVVGAIKGAIDANVDYAKNYKNAAVQFYNETMSVQNAAMMKLDVERQGLTDQLQALERKNNLTAEEVKLVDQLRDRINGLSDDISAEKLRADVIAGSAAVGGAAKWIDARRGMKYDETSDIQESLSRVQQMMNLSGTQTDVAEEFAKQLKSEFFNTDMRNDLNALNKLGEITESLKTGAEVDIPKEYSALINNAMSDLKVVLTDRHQATMTDHLTSALNKNPDALSDVVKRQVSAIEEAKVNVSQLQQKINDLQAEKESGNVSWFERGALDDQLEKLKEQLDTAKRAERSAAETASFFRQAIEGEKSLQVRLSDDDRTILDKIANPSKPTQPFNAE